MHWNNYSAKEIEFNRWLYKRTIRPKKMPDNVMGVEVWGWYDGIACYQDKDGNKYSVIAHIPIESNELCKYGKIYKVEQVDEYEYKILSEREDK